MAQPPPASHSRRSFLRGVGATVALPWMPSLAGNERPPVRLAFLFQPNGVLPAAWQVQGEGRDYRLSPILEPLAALRQNRHGTPPI